MPIRVGHLREHKCDEHRQGEPPRFGHASSPFTPSLSLNLDDEVNYGRPHTVDRGAPPCLK